MDDLTRLRYRILEFVKSERSIRGADPVGIVCEALQEDRKQVVCALIDLDDAGLIDAAWGATEFDSLGQAPGRVRFFSILSVEESGRDMVGSSGL